ncbi:hypothetical protein CBR_g57879 [Chara braunii]|uniref:RNA-directed DNA polymerase n=1 Tax=Chara braunii TaxID=69332 RepID=A0A388K8C2_CHABU|nr:hypothetical protein CBR_g57879 [Chara braunii]|eukprot:GBG66281.1 hypothetical protein CBR_g57879 [Chara braunii]
MADLVAVPHHGGTEPQLAQLFYRAMPEPLRGHLFDKSQQDDITYDVLSREAVLFESKSMSVSTFWHKDLDKGKKWKGRTISGQVRVKDHMILTLEEGGTDEVQYSQIEWGLEEEDSSVGQGRSYAAVAAGGRPQGRGGGQGQRGQATGGRGPGAQGVGGQGLCLASCPETACVSVSLGTSLTDVAEELKERMPAWAKMKKESKGQLILVDVEVFRSRVGALIDSGATRSYISPRALKKLRLGLKVQKLADPIVSVLADNRTMRVEDYVEGVQAYFRLEKDGKVEKVLHSLTLLVQDDLPFDIVLGMDWGEAAGATLHLREHECRLPSPSGEVKTARMFHVSGVDNALAHCCLSAPAFARLVKKEQLEDQVFVVYVKLVTGAKEEVSSTDLAIAKLLEEFKDLSKPPTGVVLRPIQHRIEIEPGSRAPKGAVYVMSPRELEELRKQLDKLLEKVADPSLPFVVTTDASQYGIGAVLQQDNGNGYRPVEFMSTRMPSEKVATSTYERELYSLRQALEHWKHYPLGRHFKVYSDHETLRWLKTQTKMTPKLTRWAAEIDQYDFELKPVKGKYNVVADALSRRSDYFGAIVYYLDIGSDLQEKVRQAYAHDPIYSDLLKRVKEAPETEPDYRTTEGLLFEKTNVFDRLCVPNNEEIRSLILGECHDTEGHFSWQKTLANLMHAYTWPGMKKDCIEYVYSCKVCQRNKTTMRAPIGLLRPLPIPDQPGDSVSIDFMDVGVKSRHSKSQVMVVVDRFSKYVIFVPLPAEARTELVIQKFFDFWVNEHGVPLSIVGDRDSRFTSQNWQERMRVYGSKLLMSSGRHPKTNGQTEQMNKIVQQVLRMYIRPDQINWDEMLPKVASAYNNNVHLSTYRTPNELHKSFRPRRPFEGLNRDQFHRLPPGTREFTIQHEKEIVTVVGNLTKAQHRMIEQANKHRRPSQFQVGDLVWVKSKEFAPEENISQKQGQTGKLSTAGSDSATLSTPPEPVSSRVTGPHSEAHAEVDSPPLLYSFEHYAAWLVPTLGTRAQGQNVCAASSPSGSGDLSSSSGSSRDSAREFNIEVLDPLTSEDFAWLPLPTTGCLPGPQCAALCAHLHTYLSFYAPPTSPTDDEVAVGDILAYTTKVARKFRTQRYDDDNAPLMYVRIQVGQASCSALLDSGASRNFMSQAFMQRAGLGAQVRRKAKSTAIKLADGKTQQLLDRYIEAVPVYFAPHAREPVTFDILDTDFDIILGMPWLASADHTAMLDAAEENERPFFQKLYDDAVQREREAKAAARATSIADQVALLQVPEANADRFQEKLAAAVATLVRLRNLEDLESRVTALEQRNQELQVEIISLKQSQLSAPRPPNPRPAADPVPQSNTVLMARASGTVTSAGTGASSLSGSADSSALFIVPNAWTSAQNPTVLTGVQYSGPVVDKRAATLPSKYDGKADITSWISSMRSYFEVLRTPQEDRSMIMDTNTEPAVRNDIELQAVAAGYERIDLTEWLKAKGVEESSTLPTTREAGTLVAGPSDEPESDQQPTLEARNDAETKAAAVHVLYAEPWEESKEVDFHAHLEYWLQLKQQRRVQGSVELTLFKLLINRRYIRVLINSGSTTNFFSPNGIRKAGLGMKRVELQNPCRTQVGSQEVVTSTHAVKGVRVTFDKDRTVTHELNFYVMDKCPFDAVIGLGWLKAHCLRTTWADNQFVVRDAKGNERTVLLDEAPESPVTLLSANKFCKSVCRRKEVEHVHIAFVKPLHVPSTFAAFSTSVSNSTSTTSTSNPSTSTGNNPSTSDPSTSNPVVIAVNSQSNFLSPDEDDHPPEVPTNIRQLLDRFPEVPVEPRGVPEHPVKHKIEIIDGSVPPKGCVYRMGQGELEELRRQIDDMIDRGWIRPSESEFGAPVLFVPKKGGKLRMCIDDRGLNRIPRKNAYPLPRIDDLLDAAGGCKVFSKINLKSGYHQIEVDKSDQHKIAFKTRDGLYEFIVMPFGLTNAPATFQSLMDKVLRHQLNRFVVVYLDDILIFSKCMEEHLKHLEVLQVLKEAQLHLNLEKYEFGRDSVIYLGHRLSANGLEPEATKMEVIRNWPQPANVRELRSFLGLASYYRKFVPKFSVIAHPLSRLTSKNVAYAWCEKCETAFQALKEALVSHPVLRIADPNLTFVVTTDASQFGIGAVLQQDDGVGLRPLEYYSKRMPNHKVATSTYMRELYALREALAHWKHYLLGRHFKVYSDHQTLQWIQTQIDLSPTLTRWLHDIDVYSFELKHKKGCYNRVADALSRHPEFLTCLVGSYDLRRKLKEDLVEHTAKDPDLSPILEQLKVDPNSQPDFHECEGLVFRRYGKFDRLCVPNHAPLRTHFLDLAHGRSGHFSFEKTYGSLLQQFDWPRMKGSAQKFIAECQVCQRTKVHRHKPYGLLRLLPIPDGLGESISIDFTDMGKVSEAGNSQFMVIVDRFSKFTNLISFPPHAPTEPVIKEFHQQYILQFGTPKTIVSDRDTRFISKDWKDFTSQIYDIKLNKTSGRHPEPNGLAEEINQTVIQLLRALIVPDQNTWDKELHKVKGLYNNSIHSATGVTPNQLQYGWPMRNPLSYLIPERSPGLMPGMPGYNAKYARLLKAVIAAMNKRQHAMIKHANKLRKEEKFKVGDYVWVKTSEFSDEEGISRKLHCTMALGRF